LVETIKAEVGQKDWAQREWTNLRRIKLEELMEKTHDCLAFLNQLRSRAVKGEFETGERDPVGPLNTIGELYFPELRNEVFHFCSKWRELATMGMQHALTVSSMGADVDAYRTAHDIFKEKWGPGYKELLEAHYELTNAARRLLVEIMGVDQHQ
jgi:hypothetical protein